MATAWGFKYSTRTNAAHIYSICDTYGVRPFQDIYQQNGTVTVTRTNNTGSKINITSVRVGLGTYNSSESHSLSSAATLSVTIGGTKYTTSISGLNSDDPPINTYYDVAVNKTFAAGASIPIVIGFGNKGTTHSYTRIGPCTRYDTGTVTSASQLSNTSTEYYVRVTYTKVPDTYTLTTKVGNSYISKAVIGSSSSTTTSSSYAAGTKVTITSVPKAQDGYTYSHSTWSTTGGTLASATSASTTITMPSANTTVTATGKRTARTFTVSYKYNGGQSNSYTESTATQTFTYNSSYTLRPATTFKRVDSISSTGTRTVRRLLYGSTYGTALTGTTTSSSTTTYNVAKWSTTTSGSGGSSWNAGQSGTYTLTYSPTLYAIYSTSGTTSSSTTNPKLNVGSATRSTTTLNTYTVTYNANGGSVSPTSTTARRTQSYSFQGWSNSSSSSTITYKTNTEYTFDADTTIYAVWTTSISSATVTLPTPTRDGYNFDGWYTNSALTTKAGDAGKSYTVTSTQTLYAKWSIKTYTVSYNANGKTSTMPASQTKTHDVTLYLTSTRPTTSTTASAGSYTVTLNVNGGDTLSKTSYTAARTTRYLFSEWNTATNGSGKTYNPGDGYTVNASDILYAIWDPYETVASISLPTPTRTNYDFVGWATSTSASSGTIGSYTPRDDVTLYAIWKLAAKLGSVLIWSSSTSKGVYRPWIYNGTEWEPYHAYYYSNGWQETKINSSTAT